MLSQSDDNMNQDERTVSVHQPLYSKLYVMCVFQFKMNIVSLSSIQRVHKIELEDHEKLG